MSVKRNGHREVIGWVYHYDGTAPTPIYREKRA